MSSIQPYSSRGPFSSQTPLISKAKIHMSFPGSFKEKNTRFLLVLVPKPSGPGAKKVRRKSI